jgi:adenylate cyclase
MRARSANRLVYTAIGDNVNLASRLEGLNKAYGTTILMSEDTYKEVRQHVVAREIDRVAVKGRTRGTLVFELLGLRGQVDADRIARAERYEAALELYFTQRFEAAVAIFDELAADGDAPARVLAERVRSYLHFPPPSDWDGIHQMDTK